MYSIITSNRESPIVEGRHLDGRAGSKVKWSCQDGMRLVGESESHCLSNGEWSHPVPVCIGGLEQYTAHQSMSTVTHIYRTINSTITFVSAPTPTGQPQGDAKARGPLDTVNLLALDDVTTDASVPTTTARHDDVIPLRLTAGQSRALLIGGSVVVAIFLVLCLLLCVAHFIFKFAKVCLILH